MPTSVLVSALVSPPAAKKQPAAMNPTQTSAKPAKGPSARKAQIPPSTATLTDSASNSDIASPPIDLLLQERAFHLKFACLLGNCAHKMLTRWPADSHTFPDRSFAALQ